MLVLLRNVKGGRLQAAGELQACDFGHGGRERGQYADCAGGVMAGGAFAASRIAVRRVAAAIADYERIGGIGGRHLGGSNARKQHLKREYAGDDRAHGSFQIISLTPISHASSSQSVSY